MPRARCPHDRSTRHPTTATRPQDLPALRSQRRRMPLQRMAQRPPLLRRLRRRPRLPGHNMSRLESTLRRRPNPPPAAVAEPGAARCAHEDQGRQPICASRPDDWHHARPAVRADAAEACQWCPARTPASPSLSPTANATASGAASTTPQRPGKRPPDAPTYLRQARPQKATGTRHRRRTIRADLDNLRRHQRPTQPPRRTQ